MSLPTQQNKRRKTNNPSSKPIGLELWDGRVFYCHRSTLTNAGGMFAARFGGDIPAGDSRLDDLGRSVYFVERDSKLFENHILPYLVTKRPGKLPPFSQNPELWRLLRDEAEYFGLGDLSKLLHVTHSCPRTDGNDHGVLHWLGTDKGRSEYRNPQAIGAVNVRGFIDLSDDEQEEILGAGNLIAMPLQAGSQASRQALVQYRPPVLEYEVTRFGLVPAEQCYLLPCNCMDRGRIPTIIDLKSISVRLTAYSLRYDAHGMTDWNLEGSEDGKEWTVLHRARNDLYIEGPTQESVISFGRRLKSSNNVTKETKTEIMLQHVEKNYRHTWSIEDSDTFYQYFRIIGPDPEHEGKGPSKCIHCVGMELFGDIHEA